MDLAIEDATKMVEEYLAKEEAEENGFGSALPDYEDPKIRLRVIKEMTATHEFGWVFFYGNEAHIKSGSILDAVGGNGPLIVDKVKCKLIATGTARDILYYVENYLNTGDPHSEE